MTWVWLSVAAALLQNLRSSVQKRLTATLSTNGAAAVRFLYGLPFAALYLAALCLAARCAGDALPPVPNARFAGFVIGGSLAQIAGTVLLLATFSRGSFAVGTTYSKTEGIQTVLVGYLFLGDTVSATGFGGIALTVAGVLLLSLARGGAPVAEVGSVSGEGARAMAVLAGVRRGRRRAVSLGLLSGAMFALSAVGYRGAALALGEDDFVLRAAFTLAVALGVQSVVTAVGLRLTTPGELGRIVRAWRWGLLAGASGAAASACWFTAFTLVGAAYVKAVGSVELLFAVATSWLVFRETPSRVELGGIALVMLGVVVTVLSR